MNEINEIANKAEPQAEQAVRLNEGFSPQDQEIAMKAIKDSAASASTSYALPAVEIFTSEDVKPAVKENFGKWDDNKDGRLDMDELNSALELGDTSEGEKAAAGLRKAFGAIDENHDQKLDRRELDNFYEDAEVYERTRARIDRFTSIAAQHWDTLDSSKSGDLSQRELTRFANDSRNGLSEVDRQLVREFADRDFELVAVKRDLTSATGEKHSVTSIQKSDLELAGVRLTNRAVEGHPMKAPGMIHNMYRATK